MTWKLAGSLVALRDQVNTGAPTRSKASDGTIGDAAHKSRDSDHNPWFVFANQAYVTAIDITDDPKQLRCDYLADVLWAARDPRIKYIIWDGMIMAGNAGPSPWLWRRYTGSNPHTKHLHLSVLPNSASLLMREWNLIDLFDDKDGDMPSPADLWGFPIHDLYTDRSDDVFPAGVALEWAVTHAAHAKDNSSRALSTAQRVESKVDLLSAQIDALLRKLEAQP